MKFGKLVVASATLLLAASLSSRAHAGTFDFTFTGPGVSGTIELSYGAAMDGKYPQALEVTGISGVFSDSNNGLNIVNAPIGPLVPLNHAAPEPTNLLAPDDFSKFAVSSGLPHGSLSYDNLYWPSGSPQTATDYPFHGGLSISMDSCLTLVAVAAKWSISGATARVPVASTMVSRWRPRPRRWTMSVAESR